MNISKISRSLVVVVFVALIIFIGYNDAFLILKNANNHVSLNVLKVLYAIALATFVLLYAYIKGKMYMHKVRKSNAILFRYVYIFFIVIFMSIVSIYRDLDKISNLAIALYMSYKLVISVILKKIIFNISKSDILSVIGIVAFSMIPSEYAKYEIMKVNLTNTFILLLTILIIQKLIDELKQKGVKTKKYLLISIFLGVLVGLCVLIGFNIYIWGVLAVMSLFITSNLDKTHIYFPKKFTSNLNLSLKDRLYKLERININKIIICIVIIAVVSSVFVISGNCFVDRFFADNAKINSIIVKTLVKEFSLTTNNFYDFKVNMLSSTNTILSISITYYLVFIIYIVFIEILSMFLHRRYDTKSTIIKLLFILIYVSIQIFNLNIMMYQTTISVFLILISIINTSNIYLNREERVKMLVA